ncbi:MAG: hypothetical protein AB8G95_16705 [Anaerolineae bacterium]
MIKIRLNKILLVLVFGLLATAIAACGTPPPAPEAPTVEAEPDQPLEIRVRQHENAAAIDFKYPSDWIVIVPQQGFMAIGPSETVVGDDAGPLLAVLRIPVISVHGNLEGEFNHYLDFGPKRDGYSIVQDITDFELDGRPAKQIRMRYEGNPEENEVSQEAWIVGAEANNGVVYIFAATAPPNDWEDNQLEFKLLVQSVEFNE